MLWMGTSSTGLRSKLLFPSPLAPAAGREDHLLQRRASRRHETEVILQALKDVGPRGCGRICWSRLRQVLEAIYLSHRIAELEPRPAASRHIHTHAHKTQESTLPRPSPQLPSTMLGYRPSPKTVAGETLLLTYAPVSSPDRDPLGGVGRITTGPERSCSLHFSEPKCVSETERELGILMTRGRALRRESTLLSKYGPEVFQHIIY